MFINFLSAKTTNELNKDDIIKGRLLDIRSILKIVFFNFIYFSDLVKNEHFFNITLT